MSNIRTQKWLLNRRHFLRGAGAAVALPLLDCMVPLRALGADAATRPRRSVFVYVPNGVNVLTWQIAQPGADYVLSEALQPLEKHRQNFTPISGLHHPAAIGTNHGCGHTWLTGARSSPDGSALNNTVSCDQVMAEVTAPRTRFSSLELSMDGSSLAWTRDGIPLPAESSPAAVFKRLFGEEPGGIEVRRRRLNQRGGILDAILDNAKSLRGRLGAGDRTKLDEYLHSVRDIEIRTERLTDWLTIPKPTVEAATSQHLQRDVPRSAAGDYIRTMYDMIVLALRTDMTRVVSCMAGNEGAGLPLPDIGINQTRHELSHHNGDPEVMARLSRSDVFIVQQFAYFLDQLQAVVDGEENLLDRTMVLFGSGMSYGHSHGNANLPIIFAGGKGLGLKHGRHIDYNLPKVGKYDLVNAGNFYSLCHAPTDGNARLSNLLLTMMQKMEVDAERFVDSLGPISELVA